MRHARIPSQIVNSPNHDANMPVPLLIQYFRAGKFALRHTTGFCGLVYALEQSGAHTTREQFEVADVLEALVEGRRDYRKSWSSTKHGKARRKYRANAKSIEMVRDEASEKVNPTYVSAGFGGTGVVTGNNV